MVSNVDLFAHVVTFCEYQVVLTHPSPSYPHICMSSGLTLSLSLCLSVCLSSIYLYIYSVYIFILSISTYLQIRSISLPTPVSHFFLSSFLLSIPSSISVSLFPVSLFPSLPPSLLPFETQEINSTSGRLYHDFTPPLSFTGFSDH